jgi:hypothetical protein
VSKFPTLEKEIIVLLKAHWDVGQPLYATIVQGMIKTLIQKREHNLFNYNNKNGFIIFLSWAQNFVWTNLDCTFKKAINATRKLPNDWELQGLQMAQRTTYLVKAYSIPLEL